MALQNNPIFRLASDVARGVLSRDEAFERAASREFLKTLKNKTFEEIIRASGSTFLQTDAEPPPPELTTLALISARTKGLRGELWGMLNFAHASMSFMNGDVETALNHGAEAKQILRRGGFHRGMGLCAMFLANAHLFFGKNEPAEVLQGSAQPPRRALGKSDFPTQQLQIGTAFSNMGEHERAIPYFVTAKSQFVKLMRNTSHYRSASRKALRSAQFDSKKYSFVSNIVLCELGLVWSLFTLGKYDTAFTHLATMRKRCERFGMGAFLLQADILYADICRQLGDFPKAIRVLEKSPTLDDSVPPILRFRSRMQLATLYINTEQYETAVLFVEKVRQSVEVDGIPDQVAECDRKLATIYEKLGDPETAARLLLGAKKIFEDRGMDLDAAVCDAQLAWLKLEDGVYEDALNICQRIQSFTGIWASPEFFQTCSYNLGHVLRKMGRLEEAKREYAESIQLIEQLRHGSSQPELRASYLEAKRLVYFEAIDCCLEQEDFRAALEYVERLKSRNLAEMLDGRNIAPRNASKTELEEHSRLRLRLRAASHRLSKEHGPSLGDSLLKEFFEATEAYREFVTRIRHKDPSFDPEQTLAISHADIQLLVTDSATALIEFFPMVDKTVVFVVLRDKSLQDTTVIIKDYTQASLAHDLEAIQQKDKLEETLGKLYDKLFAPLKPLLTGVTKIVFVPYSGLHLIPLHAMFSEENGSRKYLIDDFLITYAPGAKVLKQCLATVRVQHQRAFAASSNPQGDLPYAPHEAAAIAMLFDAKVHRKITRRDIVNKGRDAHIFHFTGHADGNALILHDQEAEHEEDRYDVGDIFVSLDLPEAWLVTLSACDTGKVRLGKTDEYVGLPSAFLHAGAATVICSLWPVSDISTTLLMSHMYKLIDGGSGKAEALRRAQLWLKNPNNTDEHLRELRRIVPWMREPLGQGIPDTMRFHRTVSSGESVLPKDLHKPYYWAGFVCTGVP